MELCCKLASNQKKVSRRGIDWNHTNVESDIYRYSVGDNKIIDAKYPLTKVDTSASSCVPVTLTENRFLTL